METPYGGADHPMRGCALLAAEGLRAEFCRPRSGVPAGAGTTPLPHHCLRGPCGTPLSPAAPLLMNHYVHCANYPQHAPTHRIFRKFPKKWPHGIYEISHLAEGMAPPTG
jgi:hypothetical protein